FYFWEVIQNLKIEAAARANIVLVQHVEHAPEADAIAVVHARIVRNVRLRRPALRQVLEELHIRRDPERQARIVRPLDDGSFGNRCIVEPAGCESHVVFSVRLGWIRIYPTSLTAT